MVESAGALFLAAVVGELHSGGGERGGGARATMVVVPPRFLRAVDQPCAPLISSPPKGHTHVSLAQIKPTAEGGVPPFQPMKNILAESLGAAQV